MTKKELRSFGLITGAIVLVLFGAAPWLISGKLHRWPFIIAAVLWVPAFLFPMVLEPVIRKLETIEAAILPAGDKI